VNSRHEKHLNKIIYNFIWKGVDQISRIKAEQTFENGGICLDRLSTRANSAIAMNVFRLSNPTNKHIGAKIFKSELNNLGGIRLLQGKPDTSLINAINLENIKIIVQCYSSILPTPEPTFGHLASVNGSVYSFGTFPYQKELASKGFIFVSDFYNKNGSPLSASYRLQLGLSPNAQLAFCGILSKLPSHWITDIRKDGGITSEANVNQHNPLKCHLDQSFRFYENFKLDRITEVGDFSEEPATQKKIINSFRSNQDPPCTKQRARFPEVPDCFWPKLYVRHKYTFIDTPNQSFEFNKIRDLINGNHILFKKGKVSSEKCTFCPCPEQTNKHLFEECPVINCFWLQIQDIFFEVTDTIKGVERMLGKLNMNIKDPNVIAANHVIMITAQIINKNNFERKIPTVNEVAHRLIQLYYKENIYFSTKSRKKWDHFIAIWKTISVCINKVISFSLSDGIPEAILSNRIIEQARNLQEFINEADEIQH
jgi:hypothetical protein